MNVKYILSVIFSAAVMLIFSPCVGAAVYFDDGDNLYDAGEKAYIMQLMNEASEHTGWNYGIVTMHEDYSGEYSAGTRAEAIYNEQFGEDSSGVLFLCDVGYRYVVVAGEARDYVKGSRFDNMIKKMRDQYFDYKDLQCAITFIKYTEKYYDRGKGGFDIYPPAMAAAIVFGIAAAVGTAFAVNHSYTSHEKPETNNYLDVRKMDMYRRNDTYLRSHRVRYSNNSSHSGGFGGGGGGGFGGSHGGGGFGGHR